jgi:hypothetical protein
MKTITTFPKKAALLTAALLLTLHSTLAATWLNETDTAAEADYVNLQFPASINVNAGTPTPTIYGRIYEAGVTESFGASLSILAQVGYGPASTDPRTDPNWLWFPASYNVQVGNDDEYQGSLTVNTAGSYSYTYRFSFDSGSSFTLGDLDGAGSNGGLSFSTAQLGSLEVNAVPEPAAPLLALLGGLVIAVARIRRGQQPTSPAPAP